MSLTTFNPYKQAAGDLALKKSTNKQYHKSWCRKCNMEKPLKGGTGNFTSMGSGIVPRFVCADCAAKVKIAPSSS